MKVNRLRLHGFKSFADAIDIPIQPGVTGIVGPNGCGKSNLVEALRFVMGESSYKAMRGGGMEDVIFSGSGGRPSRNTAEVTLFAERDEGMGKGPETVEIARRIERELGSSYRINGREVRARDVQILFADASTGAHSSALVRQGQVAELIAAKPEKRRGILEDAAGISGLHARRNEAEQKLRAAETESRPVERRDGRDRRTARRAASAGPPGGPLPEDLGGDPQARGNALRHQLGNGARAPRGGGSRIFAAASAVRRRDTAQAATARRRVDAAGTLPPLRDAAAAAAAAPRAPRVRGAALDREEEQLRARRQELTGRRDQAGADLQHESEIGAMRQRRPSVSTRKRQRSSGKPRRRRMASRRRETQPSWLRRPSRLGRRNSL